MIKKSTLNSPRLIELRRAKRKVLKKRIIFYSFLFLLLFLGLGFASQIPGARITEIVVSGNKIIEEKEIIKIAQDNISGNYLWLFPKNNFVIYPKRTIEENLKEKFKRIKTIEINNENVKTLNIILSEYEGKYLWCGDQAQALELSSIQKCYFLDTNGYIFDEAPFFSGDVYFKFYGKSDGNIPGSFFLKNIWSNLISFKNNLELMGLKPTAFWVDENNDGNIALSSEAMMGPKILFKIDSDFKNIAENLQSALDTEPLSSDFRSKFSSLLYLDLRFGNKVYFKFK